MRFFVSEKKYSWVTKPFVLFLIVLLVVNFHLACVGIGFLRVVEAANRVISDMQPWDNNWLNIHDEEPDADALFKKNTDEKPFLNTISGQIILGLKEGAQLESVLNEVDFEPSSYRRVHDIRPAINTFLKKHTLESSAGEDKGWYWFLGKKFKDIDVIGEDVLFSNAYKEMDEIEKKVYRMHKIVVGKDISVEAAIAQLLKNEHVEYAEPNYVWQPSGIPNDPRYPEQWEHVRTQADKYWSEQQDIDSGQVTIQDDEVVVAIVDTGVAYDHEDLKSAMWQDADGNHGRDFIDIDQETFGYLFEDDRYGVYEDEDYFVIDNDPADHYGHGTHCAGIVGAVADNGVGIAGIAQRCKIMAIRAGFAYKVKSGATWYDTAGLPNDAILQAIPYAVDNGADVISMSYGGGSMSEAAAAVYDYAFSKGVLLIAAAGNSNTNTKLYPAAHNNVFAVAATGPDDVKTFYSNYGDWVDVAAPGGDSEKEKLILSTVPHIGAHADPTGYGYMQGTSMACPYVAGLAGLILSQSEYSEFTPDEVYARMRGTADTESNELSYQAGYEGPIGSGRVNVYNAIMQESRPSVIVTERYIEDNWVDRGGSEIINITLKNYWKKAENIRLTAMTNDPYVSHVNVSYDFTSLDTNEVKIAQISFNVADDAPLNAFCNITLNIEADEYSAQNKMGYRINFKMKDGFPVQDERLFSSSSWNTTVADIVGDGRNEIITCSNEQLQVYDDSGTLVSGWPQIAGTPWEKEIDNKYHWYSHSFNPVFAVGDLTGDGSGEIAAIALLNRRTKTTLSENSWRLSSSNISGALHLFDSDGKELLNFPVKEKIQSGVSPLIGDLNDDGVQNVIFAFNNTIYAVDVSGSLLDGWPVIVEDGLLMQRVFSLADIDNDGKNELIVAKSRGYDRVLKETVGTSAVMVFRSDGTLVWQKELNGQITSPAIVCDLDDDQMCEIVLGTTTYREDEEAEQRTYLPVQLHAFRFDGTRHFDPIAITPDLDNRYINSISPIAVGDVDGDNDLEIVFGDYSGMSVYVYHHDGALMEGWPKKLDGCTLGYTAPVIADLTGDGAAEIIIGGYWLDEISAWSYDGSNVTGFPISLKDFIPKKSVTQVMPTVTDLDNDGHVDLLIATQHWWDPTENRVIILDLESEYTPDRLEWTQYQNDKENTGHYGNQKPVIVVKDAHNSLKGRSPFAVEFDASESYDPDGHSVSFLWDFDDPEATSGGYSSDPIAAHTYTLPSDGKIKIFNASLKLEDSKGAIVQETFSVDVQANNIPIMQTIGHPEVSEGESIVLYSRAVDADDDTLTYSVIRADGTDISTLGVGFTEVVIGDFDNDGDVDGSDMALFQTQWLVSSPGNLCDLNNDGVVNFVDYGIFSGNYGTIDFTGKKCGFFEWTPTYHQGEAAYKFIFSVRDDYQGQANTEVMITVKNTNRPPVIDAIDTQSAVGGDLWNVCVPVSDPDNDPLSVSVEGLPRDAEFSVRVRGDIDEDGILTNSDMFALRNYIIGADSVSGQESFLDVNRDGFINVSDMGTIRYLMGNEVPEKVVFIKCPLTNDDAGGYAARVIVNDSLGAECIQSFELTVKPSNRAPVINAQNAQDLDAGQTATSVVSVFDPDGDNVTIEVKGLEKWMSFNGNELTVSPGYYDDGVYYVTFVASDGDLTSEQIMKIVINEVDTDATIAFVAPTPDNKALHPIDLSIKAEVDSLLEASAFIDFDKSVIGWWSFADDTTDYSSYGNHAIAFGARPIQGGPRGSAYEFDGFDDYVEVKGKNGQINLGPNMTISFWAQLNEKTDTVANTLQDQYHNLIEQWSAGGFLVRVLNTGQLTSYPREDVSGKYVSTNTGYYLDWGKTYHIVYQITEIDAEKSRVTFFVNGQKIYENDLDYHVGGTNDDMLIGSWGKTAERSTLGVIDEVMTFKRKLSPAEISALYDAKNNPPELVIQSPEIQDIFYQAHVINAEGTIASTEQRVLSDGVAPSIADIEIAELDSKSVTLTWVTDQDALCAVEYGTTVEYGFMTEFSDNSQDHSAFLDALKRDALYHFRIIAKDIAGDISHSEDMTFATNEDIGVIPEPQIAEYKGFEVMVDSEWDIATDCTDQEYTFAATWLLKAFNEDVDLTITQISNSKEKKIIVGSADNPFIQSLLKNEALRALEKHSEEGYVLEVFEDSIVIAAKSSKGVFYGVNTLAQLVREGRSIEAISIQDWPHHKTRGMNISNWRSPLYLEGDKDAPGKFTQEQKDSIDRLAAWKINLMCYFDREGDFWKGPEFLKPYLELYEYLKERHIEFVPTVGAMKNADGVPFEIAEGWWFQDEEFIFGDDDIAQFDGEHFNLVLNGSFENGLEGWEQGGVTIDATSFTEGSASARIDGKYNMMYQYVHVEPNTTYHITCHAKGIDPILHYKEFDSSGNEIKSNGTYYPNSPVWESWKKFGLTFTTAENTDRVRVLVRSRTYEEAFFDDVRMYMIDGQLKNVIRTSTTDIRVTDITKTTVYKEGVDYKVVNGDTNIRFDIDFEPFVIERVPSGSIEKGEKVLVSYDAVMNYSHRSAHNTPVCFSEERLYTEYYFPAIDAVIENFDPRIIMLRGDEIRAFNRDSRNVKRGLTNAELYAYCVNKIKDYVKSKKADCRVMIWADMVNPYHNGQIDYQLGYGGGPNGAINEAVEKGLIDTDVIMAIWWYRTSNRTHMNGSIEYFEEKGYEFTGSPWYEIETNISWSEMLVNREQSLGGLSTDWGIGDIEEYYPVFVDHFWKTKQKMIYFEDFEKDADQDGLPDGWHYSGTRLANDDNLILNGSFENGEEGWFERSSEAGTPALNQVEVCEGTHSMHFISNSPDGLSALECDYFAVEPGEKYIFSGWAKAHNVQTGDKNWHTVTAIGRFYDENFERPYGDSDYMLDVKFGSGTYDWKRVSYEKIAPPDAAYFKIHTLGLSGTSTGEAWIDAMSFKKYTPDVYSVNGQNMQGGIKPGLNQCAITACGSDDSWASDYIKVYAGTEYELAVFAKADKPTTEKPNIALKWYDEANVLIETSLQPLEDVELKYKEYALRAVAPPESAFVKIYLAGQAEGDDYFWYDTVQFKSRDLTEEIKVDNQSPVIKGVTPEVDSLTVGHSEVLQFAVTAHDGDGDQLFFTWVIDGNTKSTTSSYTCDTAELELGHHTVSISITDNNNPTVFHSWDLHVEAVNNPPVIEKISDQKVSENEELFVEVAASDPDGLIETITYENLPSFATQEFNGIRFSPGYEDAGEYAITVVATDDEGAHSIFDFGLTVENVNRAPKIDKIDSVVMTEAAAYHRYLNVIDPDGDELKNVTISGAPKGEIQKRGNTSPEGNYFIVIQAVGFDSSGEYDVIITSEDVHGAIAEMSFKVTVEDKNRAPIIEQVADQEVEEGQQIEVFTKIYDPDGEVCEISLEGMPEFVEYGGDDNPVMIFTPGYEDAGEYTITITAKEYDLETGEYGLETRMTFALVVNDINQKPVISTIADQSVQEGQSITVPLSIRDADQDQLQVVVGGADFADLIVGVDQGADNYTTSYDVILRPDNDDAGEYEIIVSVTDGTVNITQSFKVTVEAVNKPPVIVSISDQEVKEGEEFFMEVVASDPDGQVASITYENLPSFVTQEITGLRFSPGYEDAGEYSITIIATDNEESQERIDFGLIVENVNLFPDFNRVQVNGESVKMGHEFAVNIGDQVTIDISALDPDKDGLDLKVKGLPFEYKKSWSETQGAGQLEFTVGNADKDWHYIELFVYDANSYESFARFSLGMTIKSVQASIIGTVDCQLYGEMLKLEGVKIDVYKADFLIQSATSDANGTFETVKLEEGSYFVKASKEHYAFYPDMHEVAINSNSDQKIIFNAHLREEKITGYVKDEEGNSASDIEIEIWHNQELVDIAKTNQNGFYETKYLVLHEVYDIVPKSAGFNFNPTKHEQVYFSTYEKIGSIDFVATRIDKNPMIEPSETIVVVECEKDDTSWATYAQGFTIKNRQDVLTGFSLYNNQDCVFTSTSGHSEKVIASGIGFETSSGGLGPNAETSVRVYFNNNREVGTYKGSYILKELRDGKTMEVAVINYAITVKDTTKPLIKITTPIANSEVSYQGFSIKGTVSDASGIEEVMLFVYDYENRSRKYEQVEINGQTWECKVDADDIRSGSRLRIYTRAKDKAGNWSNYVSQYVTVEYDGVTDIMPPVVEILSPQMNAAVPQSGFILKGKAHDDSGVTKIQISIYDTGKRSYAYGYAVWDNGLWQYSVLATDISAGKKAYVFVRAQDSAGNWSSSRYCIVNVSQ